MEEIQWHITAENKVFCKTIASTKEEAIEMFKKEWIEKDYKVDVRSFVFTVEEIKPKQ